MIVEETLTRVWRQGFVEAGWALSELWLTTLNSRQLAYPTICCSPVWSASASRAHGPKQPGHAQSLHGARMRVCMYARLCTYACVQDGYGRHLVNAVALLVELIFADNSRALHKGLVSALRKLTQPHQTGNAHLRDAAAQGWWRAHTCMRLCVSSLMQSSGWAGPGSFWLTFLIPCPDLLQLLLVAAAATTISCCCCCCCCCCCSGGSGARGGYL